MMGGGRGKKKEEYTPPVAPKPSTNYGSQAGDLASTNQNLPNDGSGSPDTSSVIIGGKDQSPGGGGYRTPITSPPPNSGNPNLGLPIIGMQKQRRPVNY
jgi:hypothetical protein